MGVTYRPERLKGGKDEVKRPEGPSAISRAPEVPLDFYLQILVQVNGKHKIEGVKEIKLVSLHCIVSINVFCYESFRERAMLYLLPPLLLLLPTLTSQGKTK